MLALPAGALPERRFEIMERVPMHPDDRSATNEKVNAGIRSGIYERDYRVIARPGEVRWLRSRGKVYHDVHGAAVRMTGSLTDITERKLAADALRASEERYSLAMEASEEGYVDVNVDTGDFVTSERLNEIFGIAHGTRFSGRRDFLSHFRFYGNDEETYQQAIRAIAADGGPDRYQFEFRIVLPSGEVRWLWTRGTVMRDAEGRPRRRVGVFSDITPRKRAEEALRASEERYSLAMEASEEGHFDWNVRTDEIFVSAHIKKVFGFSLDAQFRTRRDLIARVPYHPDDAAWLETMARDTLASDALRHEFEYRILREGEVRWMRARWKIFRDAGGAAQRVIGVVTDITDRKRAADELRESEQRFRALTELSSDWYWRQDEELRFTYVSHQVADDKYPPEWVIGKTRWELPGVTPLSSGWAEHQAVLATRQPFREFEYARIGQDGRTEYVSISGAPIFDEQGNFKGYQGTGRNITERKRMEEELRQSEARFRALTELSSDWYWRQDENLRFTYLSSQVDDLTGYSGESSLGKTRWEIANMTPLSCSWAEHQAVLAARQPFRDLECRRVGPDGTVRYLSMSGAPIFDEQGRFRGYQGIGRNITERKRAEEEVGRMERQLRQAQRLEAMGTLAGGIAHDFNNILGAILGYGEMALRDAPKGSRLRRDLDSIMTAGERGRALVDRVLAFSRSGVGERVAVPVEKVVREALDLVSAKLPPDVTLHAKLHAASAAMLGDPTQVHQVLMNLASNAVQAMPQGGTLRVSLDAQRVDAARATTIGSLAPADYVVLKVADTGTGIAPEILERIFDPFFTTKEVGTGTGLGLSLVHGIVAEVGGAIDVASAPGAGSTFTVYLPRSGDALDSFQKEEPELPRGGGQRVLIVDDEEPLVKLATRTLEELGYAPVGFTSSAAALAAFRADPQRFDAVITDERMPGMSGSALIREVRGIRDRIPIVLMSGYVGGKVATLAREAGAEEVLKKPLSARDLAASLSRMLHS
jgi:PAS domain S-box-containing protein